MRHILSIQLLEGIGPIRVNFQEKVDLSVLGLLGSALMVAGTGYAYTYIDR